MNTAFCYISSVFEVYMPRKTATTETKQKNDKTTTAKLLQCVWRKACDALNKTATVIILSVEKVEVGVERRRKIEKNDCEQW